MKNRARIVSGLAALAALFLAPLAQASLSRVSAAERTIETPALTLTASAPEPSDFSLFEGRELTLAAAESERAPSFHPLAAVSLLSEDGAEAPLVSVDELIYPKTRYRVFELLGTPLLGVERGVSLELRWRCADFSCGFASGTVGWLSQDPAGDVDSPNLYGFVKMRPHELTDPLGLGAEEDAENWAFVAGVTARLNNERARNARPPVPEPTPTLVDRIKGGANRTIAAYGAKRESLVLGAGSVARRGVEGAIPSATTDPAAAAIAAEAGAAGQPVLGVGGSVVRGGIRSVATDIAVTGAEAVTDAAITIAETEVGGRALASAGDLAIAGRAAGRPAAGIYEVAAVSCPASIRSEGWRQLDLRVGASGYGLRGARPKVVAPGAPLRSSSFLAHGEHLVVGLWECGNRGAISIISTGASISYSTSLARWTRSRAA